MTKITFLSNIYEHMLRKKARKYGWVLYYNEKTGEWAVEADDWLWPELNNILSPFSQVRRGPDISDWLDDFEDRYPDFKCVFVP